MKASKSVRTQSLRFKLVIMCLLILAIPSIVIGYQGYQSAKNSLNDLASVILENNVNFTIEMIDSLQTYVDEGKISIEDAQEKVKIHILGPKQADGTQNVSAAAEQQLASMEEISSSSAALSQMAEELQILIQKFKV